MPLALQNPEPQRTQRIAKDAKSKFLLGLTLTFTALLGGCASTGAPLPPSLELPKPPGDLRAVRKGNKVFLTWSVPAETTDRQRARYLALTRICRSLEPAMNQCAAPVAEVPTAGATPDWKKRLAAGEKITETYVDTLPSAALQSPNAELTYAVEVLNRAGRGAGISNQVHVSSVPTLPPPENFRAEPSAEGIVLTFSGEADQHPAPEISHRYRLYRRAQGSARDTLIAELPLDKVEPIRFVDHTFDWEQTYDYRVTVVTVLSQPGKPSLEIEGEDSPVDRVFAHDIYPPGVPSGLQAVFSAQGQEKFIDLVWAPDTDSDLAGYNVFRREENTEPEKINTDLVKTPAYRDNNVEPGKKYSYSVSAIDVRGNQSARSEEASEEVPR
ncbi:MAG TPA: hypothetical protein VFJ47_07030 [Terriglobales bacterium]|nr:hypothetical protein [Terriglobales bacterium]